MKQVRHPQLLEKIESFLAASGMGEKYFGKASTGNSEVVPRLRCGGRVWPETEKQIIAFIAHRQQVSPAQPAQTQKGAA